MKKFFVITVMLALLAQTEFAESVFAQNLRFGGFFESGLGVWVSDVNGYDPFVKAHAVDSERDGYRFRFNGSYQNEERTIGFNFRLQSQGRLDRGGYFSLPFAYGWVNFLDNKLSLTGGLVDDNTYTTADWWINEDMGEGLGLLLKAAPIDGLSLGVGAYILSQQGGGDNNALLENDTLANFNITRMLDDLKYTFNVAYTLQDVFRVGASFRTQNKAGNDGASSPREQTSLFFGEFRLLAVKGLTAVVVTSLENLETFGADGNIVISETFAYKVNDELNIGLNAVQFLYSRSAAFDPGLLFNLWGSYAFDNIVPRLDLVYFMGGRSRTIITGDGGNRGFNYHRRGFENRPSRSDQDNDVSVVSIRPSVKFNIDSRTSIEIGNLTNLDFAKNNAYHPLLNDADPPVRTGTKDSMVSNVSYINMRWSF